MSKARVLFVIEDASFGGGEKGFAQLIKGMDRSRFELYAACPPDGRFAGMVSGHAAVLPFRMERRFSPIAVAKLARLIRSSGAGVVHSQGARADMHARLAARLAGVPCVSTLQMPVEGFDVGRLRRAVYAAADRFSSLFCDRVIVVSRELERYAREERSFPPEKIDLVHNAPGPEFFSPAPASRRFREEVGAGDKFLVGAAARLVKQKGFPFLLEALSLLKRDSGSLFGRMMVAIAGEGELAGELRSDAARRGLDNVIFCGFTGDPAGFMSSLDLFIMPSLAEGQPNSLLEAMALGKPVVASDISGVRESVRDGIDAILVPPGDPVSLAGAVKRVAEDASLARRLGTAAAEAARTRFSHTGFVAEHERIYGELLRGRG